jgi:hypothetical protein
MSPVANSRSNSLAIVLAAGLAHSMAACALDTTGDIEGGDEEVTTEEAVGPGADSTAAASVMRRDCKIGCPDGWHPTGYYCANCSIYDNCFVSYNSQVCEKDELPQITQCGTGSCPPGWTANYTFCDQDCNASAGAICTVSNATKCTAIGSIASVTDSSGQLPVRVGQPISIWGNYFLPEGTSVTMYQYPTNNPDYKVQWELPSQNGSYWWNGNESQINTIIPPDAYANSPLAIEVATGAWRAPRFVITPEPAP